MAAEEAMIFGPGILACLFAYYAFKFLHQEHGEEQGEQVAGTSRLRWEKIIGTLCLILSIVFINVLMDALVLISQNTAGLSYLSNSVYVVGLQAVMWGTLAVLALYTFVLLLGSISFIYHAVMSFWKGRGKGDLI